MAEIHSPLPIPQDGSLEDRVEELTAVATAAIERQVRAHPEQWVWMHRRWRTRPKSD
jgi:KDO2-lipid IV(A) lauroyltransferase